MKYQRKSDFAASELKAFKDRWFPRETRQLPGMQLSWKEFFKCMAPALIVSGGLLVILLIFI